MTQGMTEGKTCEPLSNYSEEYLGKQIMNASASLFLQSINS